MTHWEADDLEDILPLVEEFGDDMQIDLQIDSLARAAGEGANPPMTGGVPALDGREAAPRTPLPPWQPDPRSPFSRKT